MGKNDITEPPCEIENSDLTQVNELTNELHQLNIDVGEDSNSHTSDRVVGNILSNDDTLYYNMNHKYRGKAIIFNHENFEVGDLKPRLGTRFDCITLEKSLIKLGFDVIIYADFTVEEMDEKLSYWARMDYTDYDSFLIAVLSYGEKGIIYARNGSYRPECNLWSRFTDDTCATLINKPKLFFIQACQVESDGSSFIQHIPHLSPDVLMAYSVIPGLYAWQDTQRGSWYVQALCEAFDRYGYQMDIISLMTSVNRQVINEYNNNVLNNITMHQQFQMPGFTSKLKKLIKFTEKN